MKNKLNGTSLLIVSILLTTSLLAAAKAGDLDKTFGKAGIVTTNFGNQTSSNNFATATAVALQPDGKIVLCGAIPGTRDFPIPAVARYHADGELDKSFGQNGIASISSLEDAPFTSIALQPDGKIVAVAGGFTAFVVRFTTSGQLDSTFGTSGIVTLEFINGPAQSGVVVQADGKILVANHNLFRFHSDGQPDATFGSGGAAPTAGYPASGLALLPNGKILVASSEVASGFISQYDPNGNLDATFGIAGQIASPGSAAGLALPGSGDFLAGGTLTNNTVRAANGSTASTFAVSRYLNSGVIDSAFGSNGGTATPVPNFLQVATSGLALEPTGDIVTAGTATEISTVFETVFALARYTTSGQLDTSFGNNGTIVTSFANGSQLPTVSANGLTIQPDGKIVVVGSYAIFVPYHGFDTAFKIARYLGQ